MNIKRAHRRAGHRCVLILLMALVGGCGGGSESATGFGVPIAAAPAAMTAPAELNAATEDPDSGGAVLTPTVAVGVMPVPEDPSVITRFTKTVPFGEKGAYQSSVEVIYEWDQTAFSDPAQPLSIRTIPLRGTVRYPKAEAPPGGFPVVVFLHGMHDSETLMNPQGYDYLQQDLAEHGYVAFSIDAAKINELESSDTGALARGQLILTTLDVLRAGQHTGIFNGVESADLKDKLDLSRIGLVGHSRGAEAVAYAVALNQKRIGISYADVKTASAIARAYDKAKTASDKAMSAVERAKVVAAEAAEVYFKAKKANLEALNEKKPAVYDEARLNELLLASLSTQALLDKKEKVAHEADAALRKADAKHEKLAFMNEESESWLKDLHLNVAQPTFGGVVLPSSEEPPHSLLGVFSIAPINATRVSNVTQVPFATLLPQCDGDVRNLEGSQIFDDSRYAAVDESSPKYQILVRGANHNIYNTYWSEQDDATYDHDGACRPVRENNKSIRMSADDQRRNGQFLIESFMRYFVGGELEFGPYWKGQAPIPATACPAGETRCDEWVSLTIHQPAERRKLLQNFQKPESSSKNPLGFSTLFANFTQAVQCQSLFVSFFFAPDRSALCTDPVRNNAAEPIFDSAAARGSKQNSQNELSIWSVTDQAQMQWIAAGPTVVVNTGDLATAGFDVLSFRVSVLAPVGQEVEVSLIDTHQRTVTMKGSDFTDALYNIARKPNGSLPLVDAAEDAIYVDDGIMRPLLNMVAIPLKAFALQGVDMAHIAQVKLRFPKASGSVAITDVQLQRMD